MTVWGGISYLAKTDLVNIKRNRNAMRDIVTKLFDLGYCHSYIKDMLSFFSRIKSDLTLPGTQWTFGTRN